MEGFKNAEQVKVLFFAGNHHLVVAVALDQYVFTRTSPELADQEAPLPQL